MQTLHPWRTELRSLLSNAGVPEAVIDAADQKFHEAMCADPIKRLSVEELLSIESNFRDFEEDYGVAWNSRTGDYETFTGPNRTAIVLAYANRIYNQDLTPLADQASDLIFEAWVPEDVFEQACEILGRVKRQWVFEQAQAKAEAPADDASWTARLRALLAEKGLEGALLDQVEDRLSRSVKSFLSEMCVDPKTGLARTNPRWYAMGNPGQHTGAESIEVEVENFVEKAMLMVQGHHTKRARSTLRERRARRRQIKAGREADAEHFVTSDPQLTDLLNLAVDICANGGNMDSALLLQSRLEAVEARLAKSPPPAAC